MMVLVEQTEKLQLSRLTTFMTGQGFSNIEDPTALAIALG